VGAIKVGTEQVIQQLEASRGNVSHAAGKLKTSRRVLHKYINEHPTVKEALADIREAAIDRGETLLQARMESSDSLLIFFLKTQGHSRGYGDKSDTNHGGELVLRVKYGDDGTDDPAA
jgi:hypothetical protein